MEFRRTIKLGMSGADGLYMKRKLFDLGMYSNKIKRITSNKFRIDSVNATKKFQETYDSVCEGPLEVTGTIYAGILTHMVKNGVAFFLLYVVGMQ